MAPTYYKKERFDFLPVDKGRQPTPAERRLLAAAIDKPRLFDFLSEKQNINPFILRKPDLDAELRAELAATRAAKQRQHDAEIRRLEAAIAEKRREQAKRADAIGDALRKRRAAEQVFPKKTFNPKIIFKIDNLNPLIELSPKSNRVYFSGDAASFKSEAQARREAERRLLAFAAQSVAQRPPRTEEPDDLVKHRAPFDKKSLINSPTILKQGKFVPITAAFNSVEREADAFVAEQLASVGLERDLVAQARRLGTPLSFEPHFEPQTIPIKMKEPDYSLPKQFKDPMLIKINKR